MNGVQDEIRAGTTIITTRLFPEINSTDIITANVREFPSRQVVTRTYYVNDISTVSNEGRYVVITASLVVPNSQGYLDFEAGNENPPAPNPTGGT